MNDRQLLRFATEFRDGILDGGSSHMMCFAVCAPLSPLLATHGVPNEMEEVDLGACNHFFLRLPDGRVLDPTADQFNHLRQEPMPPVYLGPPANCHGDEQGYAQCAYPSRQGGAHTGRPAADDGPTSPPASPVHSGHPRCTSADKRRDVLALLNPGNSQVIALTDQEIARRAGVSPQTVGNIRRPLA